jgi:DNA-binding IclR family transcriptional regulator
MKKKAVGRRERLGIQSVEVAGRILAAMAKAAQPLQLKDLARRCEMPAAKVHRYLVSLARAELVTQDSEDGRYGIGPAAIALGLAGLHALDVARIASGFLTRLRDESGETAVLAVWSDAGPVVIRIEESSRPVFMNVRVGSTLPMLRSAVGKVFAAHLPREEIEELTASPGGANGKTAGAAHRLLSKPAADAIRRSGLAVVRGDLVPGVAAVAAPIFDHRGRIIASIAVLGGPEHLPADTTSRPARLLRSIAATISRRLGFVPALVAE